jgi:branched-chain amino acid transport system ATP-binding protein
MMHSVLLEVQDIDVFYGASHILFALGFQVNEGETVALLGRNGAGKSTTMKSLVGLTPPRHGSVRLEGREIRGVSPHIAARRGIGYVPEDRQMFPEHSIQDNLMIGAKKGPNGEDFWNLSQVYRFFPLLEPMRHRMAGHLSGGEQQLVTIARTLMGNPRVLLLDEPSEGLAPIIVSQIAELVTQLRSEGTTILLAEQNMSLCMNLATEALVIDKGHIVYRGAMTALRNDDAVKKRYLAI